VILFRNWSYMVRLHLPQHSIPPTSIKHINFTMRESCETSGFSFSGVRLIQGRMPRHQIVRVECRGSKLHISTSIKYDKEWSGDTIQQQFLTESCRTSIQLSYLAFGLLIWETWAQFLSSGILRTRSRSTSLVLLYVPDSGCTRCY